MVRQDQASAEPDRRGDHQGVDSQVAPSVSLGEEVPSVAGDECRGLAPLWPELWPTLWSETSSSAT